MSWKMKRDVLDDEIDADRELAMRDGKYCCCCCCFAFVITVVAFCLLFIIEDMAGG